MAERRCKKCFQPVSGHRGKFGIAYCQNQANPGFKGITFQINEIILDKKNNGQVTVEQIGENSEGKMVFKNITDSEAIASYVTEIQDDLETSFQQTMYQKDVRELIGSIGQASDNQRGTLETIAKAMQDANQTQTELTKIMKNISEKPKEVKDPICPKLKTNQKLETFWREVDNYEKEMIDVRDVKTAEIVMKREMLKNLKECEVEEVKKFTLEHILEIEEGLKGVKDIKAKIEERFGQTDRQKDLETRTRFLGLKLDGDVTDFVNYLTRERKKFVESLKHPGIVAVIPENILD